jgi:hypothetical protein
MRFSGFKFSKRGMREKPNQGKTESGTEHHVETHNQVEQKIIPLLREGVPHTPSAAPPMFEPSSIRCRPVASVRAVRAGG